MSLTATRGLLAIAGVVDLAASLLMLTSYHSHAVDATLLLDVAIILQALHVFSWFGTLLFASGGPGLSFGQMMLATYVFVFFLDVASFAVRAFVPRDSLFSSVTFWTALGMAIDAGAAILFYWLAIKIASSEGVEEEDEEKPREPWTQTLQRRLLPWMWVIEIVFAALQIGFWAGGLTRSAIFSRIVLFEAPHVFLWLLHRAITGGLLIDDSVGDPGWIRLGTFVGAAMSIAGAAAAGFRFYYIFSGADETAALLPTLPIVWGWLQFGFGAALLLASLVQMVTLGSIATNERPEAIELSKSLGET